MDMPRTTFISHGRYPDAMDMEIRKKTACEKAKGLFMQ
ncbi:hypothetical protein ACPOL_3107 [Acidisarcina polymorpha]|uniref:Uncharacterized protein n=1 Tax=Acidisarcina polymorpha TaxID=2211140 RepID=A0A2Z5FZZ2_9BACT|nr:hypothetical protein ACPOL_3107 [Acidisarcina polymorpha]